ncbi:MAG: LysE family translocator [Pseudomonadota bacterium]
MWAEFLITSLIVVLLPGTGVIYTVGIGLSQGAWPSVAAAAGCTLGIVPHIAAAILGVAAILSTSPVFFSIFKLAGVAFLLYLAWSVLQDSGPMRFATDSAPKSAPATALSGFLINILNPKLSVFFLAFLPQFVPVGTAAPLARMLLLSAIFMAMTFLVFVIYGTFAARLRASLLENEMLMKWAKRGFAVAFITLSLRLLVATV